MYKLTAIVPNSKVILTLPVLCKFEKWEGAPYKFDELEVDIFEGQAQSEESQLIDVHTEDLQTIVRISQAYSNCTIRVVMLELVANPEPAPVEDPLARYRIEYAVEVPVPADELGKPKLITLTYNKYKGSGKCWIATIDPLTKKVLGFLDAESRTPRDNYSGEKNFLVPMVEGAAYSFCESGSKTRDDRWYAIVKDGKLVKM